MKKSPNHRVTEDTEKIKRRKQSEEERSAALSSPVLVWCLLCVLCDSVVRNQVRFAMFSNLLNEKSRRDFAHWQRTLLGIRKFWREQ